MKKTVPAGKTVILSKREQVYRWIPLCICRFLLSFGFIVILAPQAQAQSASIGGDLRNTTVEIGDSMKEGDVVLNLMKDQEKTKASGGVTVKRKEQVSFDETGSLITKTAGFWKGLEAQTYTVTCYNNEGAGIAKLELQGEVRWDSERNVIKGKENFLRINTRSAPNKWIKIEVTDLVDGRLIIVTEKGKSYIVDMLSNSFMARIEEKETTVQATSLSLTMSILIVFAVLVVLCIAFVVYRRQRLRVPATLQDNKEKTACFSYTALTKTGERVSSKIEAIDTMSAMSALKLLGLTPTSITTSGWSTGRAPINVESPELLCPKCNKVVKVDAREQGKDIACPSCNENVQVSLEICSFGGKPEIISFLVIGILSLATFVVSLTESSPTILAFVTGAISCIFALPFGLIVIAGILSEVLQVFTPGGGRAIPLFVWNGGIDGLSPAEFREFRSSPTVYRFAKVYLWLVVNSLIGVVVTLVAFACLYAFMEFIRQSR